MSKSPRPSRWRKDARRSKAGSGLADGPVRPCSWSESEVWILASEPAAGHQLRGDHVSLDFIGALPDDHQRGVAEVPLDVVFGGIPVAAMDSDGVQRDLHRHLGGEQLGHPGLHVAALAAVK